MHAATDDRYNGSRPVRQRLPARQPAGVPPSGPRVRRIAGLVLLAGLTGCGLTPFGNDGIDSTTTGSITPAATPAPAAPVKPLPTVVDSVDPSDWEAIRDLAARRLDGAPNGVALDWSNPDTGNSGTIAALAGAKSRDSGLACRPIALTVSDVRGVRRYHGNACRVTADFWQLSDMTADDKTLL